jgi:hypothetical protein
MVPKPNDGLNKRERLLIERFRRSGRTIDQEKLDAPFRFLVRPLSMVGLDAGKFALWFEEEIFSGIKKAELAFPIRSILISPQLIDESVSRRPLDAVRFKRRENAIFAGISIDHSIWLHSSDNAKLMLMYENIKQSTLEIPQKYIGIDGREALLNIIDNAYTKLQQRLKH